MNRLKRSPDENLREYKLRLFKNKDLYNISYQKIADLLNEETGQNYGESKYRKYMTPFIDGYDFAIRNNASIKEAIAELDQKEKEFNIAKIQFQDQRREYNSYLRHEGRLDNLLKKLLNSIEDDLENKKPLEWYNRDMTGLQTSGDNAGILLLSDIHKGLDTSHHWNTYNNDVFKKRLSQVVNDVILMRDKHEINELHVLSLGDLIHGMIHRLTRIKETEDAIQATQSVAESFSEMLSIFANNFPKVKFYSVKGNHDRVSARKEEEINTESFHEFIPWYIESRLSKFENVEVVENEVDGEILIADIKGHTYFGVHGHLDNVSSSIQNLTLMMREFPTAVFSAHIHRNYENEIHGIDLITNPPFAGTDDYAKNRRLTSKARQKFVIADKYGIKGEEYIRFSI